MKLSLGDSGGLSTEDQHYDPNPMINELRRRVDAWRARCRIRATGT